MLDDVLAIPDHLRDALFRVESARLPRHDAAGLLVCGMGGSAIGGDLAAAALGGRLERPLLSVRDYALPSWTTAEWSVLCSSYSGETEETLACFEAAGELGAPRVVATTGGALGERARAVGAPVIGLPGLLPAPRTGVAYGFVCAAETAAAAGVGPSLRGEVEAAAAFLERERDELRHRAAEIAAAIGERLPVVYGAGPTVAVADRWKTQANENAELPAFRAELPEAGHNEICAWAGEPASHLAAILLEDRDQHPRVLRSFELTAAEIEHDGLPAVRIETAGESRCERLLWAVMLGDLVSLQLAEARGVDPLPTAALDRLKSRLSSA